MKWPNRVDGSQFTTWLGNKDRIFCNNLNDGIDWKLWKSFYIYVGHSSNSGLPKIALKRALLGSPVPVKKIRCLLGKYFPVDGNVSADKKWQYLITFIWVLHDRMRLPMWTPHKRNINKSSFSMSRLIYLLTHAWNIFSGISDKNVTASSVSRWPRCKRCAACCRSCTRSRASSSGRQSRQNLSQFELTFDSRNVCFFQNEEECLFFTFEQSSVESR